MSSSPVLTRSPGEKTELHASPFIRWCGVRLAQASMDFSKTIEKKVLDMVHARSTEIYDTLRDPSKRTRQRCRAGLSLFMPTPRPSAYLSPGGRRC
jgi:hypothetical protein